MSNFDTGKLQGVSHASLEFGISGEHLFRFPQRIAMHEDAREQFGLLRSILLFSAKASHVMFPGLTWLVQFRWLGLRVGDAFTPNRGYGAGCASTPLR